MNQNPPPSASLWHCSSTAFSPGERVTALYKKAAGFKNS